MAIPGDVRQLLDAPGYVHLSRPRADGSPRNWVVWVGLEDDYILVRTSDAIWKAKDMRRDPRSPCRSPTWPTHTAWPRSGATSLVLALAALRALHVDPRRSPALTSQHLPGNPAVVRQCRRRGATMTESQPRNDLASFPAPAEGILMAMFITVRKVARSRDFYSRVLGGTVILEENPCTVRLSNSWIIMNPGGPPTPDKPGISVVDYQRGNTTSIFLNLRVADIQACYQEWKAKGAEFVTPPIDRGVEIRCYMRDPDGYLIEVGQSTGLLQGHLAAKRPEDLPG
jgi:predicted enzyme related to lactoylglutathione lyase